MTQQHINIADTELSLANEKMKLEVNDLRLYYGESLALKNINLKIPEKRVTAFIGPSGCGKSTLLRCFNRMNDLVDICRIEGQILMDGQNIYDPKIDVAELRRQVGMVFQKPNPFPKSIYDNIAYGPRIHGLADNKDDLDRIVESSLKKAEHHFKNMDFNNVIASYNKAIEDKVELSQSQIEQLADSYFNINDYQNAKLCWFCSNDGRGW